MRPLAPRALLFLALSGAVRAGQIEAPVSGQSRTGTQTGTIGGALGAPAPVQMSVPSLSGAAPLLAPALTPAPVPAAAIAPAPAVAAPIPALPNSAVAAAAKIRSLEARVMPAPSAPAAHEPGVDPGRAMFDQGSSGGEAAGFTTPRSVVRRDQSRSSGWEVDGAPAKRLSGGGFKEVLVHPGDSKIVLKLFSEMGARDAEGSLSETRREMRNLKPLLAIKRAPKVIEQGALELRTPFTKGTKVTGYIAQERVEGRELADLLADRDPAVRARAVESARALFEDLIAARVKLEDERKMTENISVGRAAGRGAEKAWVLDAGEATLVPARSLMDKVLGRPDPLRAYYDGILAELSRRARI